MSYRSHMSCIHPSLFWQHISTYFSHLQATNVKVMEVRCAVLLGGISN